MITTRLITALSALAPAALVAALPAQAADRGLFARYNLGVGYATTTSYAAISYQAPAGDVLPDDCQRRGDDAMRCTAYLAPDASSGGGDLTVISTNYASG